MRTVPAVSLWTERPALLAASGFTASGGPFRALLRRMSLSSPAWYDGWMDKLLRSNPPPSKYLPQDGSPATAEGIHQRMLEIGGPSSENTRALLSRGALHFLLRSCHKPGDLETARAAMELYRLKAIEINEETALLYVKACCRVGRPLDGLEDLKDPNMRVGLWSSPTAWNYLIARLDSHQASHQAAEGAPEGAPEGAEDPTAGVEPTEGVNAALSAPPVPALAAYEAMAACGAVPNGHTLHIVCRSLVGAGLAAEASALKAEAARAGLKLLPATEALLTAGSAEGSAEDLKVFLESAARTEPRQFGGYFDDAALPSEAQLAK